jgi:hypothetical protein
MIHQTLTLCFFVPYLTSPYQGNNGGNRQYRNEQDGRKEQRREGVDFCGEIVRFIDDHDFSGVRTSYLGQYIWEYVQLEQTLKDVTWALAALVTVFVYMSFHTGSIFLACAGMFGIISAFALACR